MQKTSLRNKNMKKYSMKEYESALMYIQCNQLTVNYKSQLPSIRSCKPLSFLWGGVVKNRIVASVKGNHYIFEGTKLETRYDHKCSKYVHCFLKGVPFRILDISPWKHQRVCLMLPGSGRTLLTHHFSDVVDCDNIMRRARLSDFAAMSIDRIKRQLFDEEVRLLKHNHDVRERAYNDLCDAYMSRLLIFMFLNPSFSLFIVPYPRVFMIMEKLFKKSRKKSLVIMTSKRYTGNTFLRKIITDLDYDARFKSTLKIKKLKFLTPIQMLTSFSKCGKDYLLSVERKDNVALVLRLLKMCDQYDTIQSELRHDERDFRSHLLDNLPMNGWFSHTWDHSSLDPRVDFDTLLQNAHRGNMKYDYKNEVHAFFKNRKLVKVAEDRWTFEVQGVSICGNLGRIKRTSRRMVKGREWTRVSSYIGLVGKTFKKLDDCFLMTHSISKIANCRDNLYRISTTSDYHDHVKRKPHTKLVPHSCINHIPIPGLLEEATLFNMQPVKIVELCTIDRKQCSKLEMVRSPNLFGGYDYAPTIVFLPVMKCQWNDDVIRSNYIKDRSKVLMTHGFDSIRIHVPRNSFVMFMIRVELFKPIPVLIVLPHLERNAIFKAFTAQSKSSLFRVDRI